jgi:hypothetical protein
MNTFWYIKVKLQVIKVVSIKIRHVQVLNFQDWIKEKFLDLIQTINFILEHDNFLIATFVLRVMVMSKGAGTIFA